MNKNGKSAYDLSDAEKRDLIQLIQQGKALPEKYRFVLFEDTVASLTLNPHQSDAALFFSYAGG